MIQQLTARLNLHRNYKRAFGTPDGQKVLQHIIRTYVMNDPVSKNHDETLINVGMQRCAHQMLSKVFDSDEVLVRAIEQAQQQNNQTENNHE